MRLFPGSQTVVMFGEKHILGWVFIFYYNAGRANVFTFVNERYRRRGIAYLLIQEVLKDFQTVALAKWNKATELTFKKLQKRHPRRIVVYDWWKNLSRFEELLNSGVD